MLEFDFAKTELFVRVVAFARYFKYHYDIMFYGNISFAKLHTYVTVPCSFLSFYSKSIRTGFLPVPQES